MKKNLDELSGVLEILDDDREDVIGDTDVSYPPFITKDPMWHKVKMNRITLLCKHCKHQLFSKIERIREDFSSFYSGKNV